MEAGKRASLDPVDVSNDEMPQESLWQLGVSDHASGRQGWMRRTSSAAQVFSEGGSAVLIDEERFGCDVQRGHEVRLQPRGADLSLGVLVLDRSAM